MKEKTKEYLVPSSYSGNFSIRRDGSSTVEVRASEWFNASDLRFFAAKLIKAAKKLEKAEAFI